MNAQSEKSTAVKIDIEHVLSDDDFTELDKVTARECTNIHNNLGVEVKMYGMIVSTRPIIEYVAEQEHLGIRDLYHCSDTKDPHLVAFITYLPEQPHPAFVDK